MKCIVSGKIFDTDRADLILTCRDNQNEFQYFRTVKGNFVVLQRPAPEFKIVSYSSPVAQLVSEGNMKTILGMYDLDKYEEIFGVEDLEIL